MNFLEAEGSQAVFGLYKGRWPVLHHWGLPLREADLDDPAVQPNGYSVFGDNGDKTYTPNRLPLDYPSGLDGDFRSPAFAARGPAGPALGLLPTWQGLTEGLPALGPLPGARLRPGETGVSTLTTVLDDPVTGLRVEVRATALDGVLLRSVRFENRGDQPLSLTRAFSFSFDLHVEAELDLIALDGAWARERHLRRFALPTGRWEASSRRGVSSHQAWPGVVLAERSATETRGECWGAALVWSGDWSLGAERDEDGGWRVQGGLNPEFLARTLAPGEVFLTPQAVLVHSAEGLSGLSRRYHRFVLERLLPPAWARRERPVVANNWEATYWSFTQDKLLALADRAAAAGVEVFVLDDGWFGRRDNDRTSLGDWTPDLRKLPQGLAGLQEELARRGLGFGLWVEPEMVSADSDLYRAHPDWCLHLEGRDRVESRHQLVLDLTRPEVRDHLVGVLTDLLGSVPLAYVKWDMNRPLSHTGADRYAWTLGLYDLLGRVTAAFPDILFEGCCGGGGRMDFGLLSLVPQYWVSDNTDALARLAIQEGTSLFLPPLVMGCHVSTVPNHQTGRVTTLSARTRVAFGGNLGYELDFTALGPDDLAQAARATAWYKTHRSLIQFGTLRRTRTSLDAPNTVAWQVHAPDGSQVLLLWFRPRVVANARFPLYRCEGLEPEARYELTWFEDRAAPTLAWGADLMHRGLLIPLAGADADGVALTLSRRPS